MCLALSPSSPITSYRNYKPFVPPRLLAKLQKPNKVLSEPMKTIKGSKEQNFPKRVFSIRNLPLKEKVLLQACAHEPRTYIFAGLRFLSIDAVWGFEFETTFCGTTFYCSKIQYGEGGELQLFAAGFCGSASVNCRQHWCANIQCTRSVLNEFCSIGELGNYASHSVFVPNSESVGLDPWGRGVVAGKCTPRKTGTVLEHLGTLLEPSWNLAGTLLEPCWNIAGTVLEPCCGTLLEPCSPGTLLEPHWNHVGTFVFPLWLRCLVAILDPKTSSRVLSSSQQLNSDSLWVSSSGGRSSASKNSCPGKPEH